MKYEFAPDLQLKAERICKVLFPHVKVNRISCLRSRGSSTKNTIARCHALGKLMQKAMGTTSFYALEFLAEKFDKLSEEEQEKVIIHELMHIPKTFGGGFKHHDWVTDKNVNKHYNEYKRIQEEKQEAISFVSPLVNNQANEKRKGVFKIQRPKDLFGYFKL